MASSTPPVSTPPVSIPPPWTPQLDKAFEKALAMYDGNSADRWDKISAMVPGMDSTEVERHYEKLVEDLNSIETGRIALPNYSKLSMASSSDEDSPTLGRKSSHAAGSPGCRMSPGGSGGTNAGGSGSGAGSGKGSSSKSSDPERRKGIPWSEEEHRLFLLGLAKFGKGDWRSISRNFVISRTPTQVASHAQKYFIRLSSMNNKDKRRSSIHDITSVNDGGESLPPSPGPITGLPSPNAAQWPRAGVHAGGMYDMSQMGGPGDHQMRGQILMAPAGHPHHPPYGHVPVRQAQPMAMQHMAYAVPQSANG